MGNCQVIDAATLVIQHPCGKSDKLYWPVSAAEVMKTNPGHYVALLISSAPSSADAKGNQVRVTRMKLLRPLDILVMGQVYRLITNQEVKKVLSAKKHAKMLRQGQEIRVEQQQHEKTRESHLPDVRRKNSLVDKHDERQRQHQPTTRTANHSATVGRSKPWQPTLKSITETV